MIDEYVNNELREEFLRELDWDWVGRMCPSTNPSISTITMTMQMDGLVDGHIRAKVPFLSHLLCMSCHVVACAHLVTEQRMRPCLW